jgi:hypothetical protein
VSEDDPPPDIIEAARPCLRLPISAIHYRLDEIMRRIELLKPIGARNVEMIINFGLAITKTAGANFV